MRLGILALIVMVVAAPSCRSSMSPDQISVSLAMGENVSSLRTFSSSTSGNSVTVLGGIATPDPCYNFGASVATTGRVIEAKVTAATKGGVCIGLFNQQNYTLTVLNIPPGNWTVRVLHQRDAGAPAQQYETAVTIK